jgi:biotin carboxyl carrier protein
VERFREETGSVGGKKVISTPMPGQIVKIQVKEGQIVNPNQNLFIVESMKMENQIKSTARARVDRIHFKDGDPVKANAPIVELSLVGEEKNEQER